MSKKEYPDTSYKKRMKLNEYIVLPLTLKVYCECGEDFKLCEGESVQCYCGKTVSRS